jgi:hypothetical protein
MVDSVEGFRGTFLMLIPLLFYLFHFLCPDPEPSGRRFAESAATACVVAGGSASNFCERPK